MNFLVNIKLKSVDWIWCRELDCYKKLWIPAFSRLIIIMFNLLSFSCYCCLQLVPLYCILNCTRFYEQGGNGVKRHECRLLKYRIDFCIQILVFYFIAFFVVVILFECLTHFRSRLQVWSLVSVRERRMRGGLQIKMLQLQVWQ